MLSVLGTGLSHTCLTELSAQIPGLTDAESEEQSQCSAPPCGNPVLMISKPSSFHCASSQRCPKPL